MSDTTTSHTLAVRLPTAGSRLNLSTVRLFDAATCLAMGAALLAATATLGVLLGLPEPLLTSAGILLLACAVPMVAAGLQRPPSGWLVTLVVLGNLAWALASGYIAFATPGITGLGRAFVVAQAVAVIVLAWLEWGRLAAERR